MYYRNRNQKSLPRVKSKKYRKIWVSKLDQLLLLEEASSTGDLSLSKLMNNHSTALLLTELGQPIYSASNLKPFPELSTHFSRS